jgi:DNA-binding GntR family transcriptional regulator
LLPGTRLRETNVAEAFSVSRNTVREVFRLLAHERLLDYLPHRGVSVRRVTPTEIREVYVVRRLLEPLGATAALTDATARARLRRTVADQSAAVATGDWGIVGTADIEFHRVLVACCGSAHLSVLFDSLLAELRLAFLLLPDRQALHEPYVPRNAALCALLDAGDREAVLAEITDYLEVSERHVLSFVEPAPDHS